MTDLIYGILTEGWRLWLIIGILFFLAEGANPGTFALFFGGLGAWITSLICRLSPFVTGNGTWQLLIFSGASLLSLYALRPVIMRLLNIKETLPPDAFTGKTAEALTALRKQGQETGRVSFEGTEWRARLCDGGSRDEVPVGTIVRIVKSEGLTLYVEPLQ